MIKLPSALLKSIFLSAKRSFNLATSVTEPDSKVATVEADSVALISFNKAKSASKTLWSISEFNKAKEETVSIQIPAGVTEGVQLKVAGKGNEAPGKNSVSGDLLVVIEEISHEFLKREGTNIHFDLYVNYSEAVLGISKEIETVTGKVKIKIV